MWKSVIKQDRIQTRIIVELQSLFRCDVENQFPIRENRWITQQFGKYPKKYISYYLAYNKQIQLFHPKSNKHYYTKTWSHKIYINFRLWKINKIQPRKKSQFCWKKRLKFSCPPPPKYNVFETTQFINFWNTNKNLIPSLFNSLNQQKFRNYFACQLFFLFCFPSKSLFLLTFFATRELNDI